MHRIWSTLVRVQLVELVWLDTSWNSHIGVWLKPIVMVFLIRTDIGISDHRWFNWLVRVRTCFPFFHPFSFTFTHRLHAFLPSTKRQSGNEQAHSTKEGCSGAGTSPCWDGYPDEKEVNQRERSMLLNFIDMAKALIKRMICRSDLVS